MKTTGSWGELYPAHTCVDQPILPCPACLRWTGDGFATVKSNPQCFPGLDRNAPPPVIEYEESGFAVVVPAKWDDGWSWDTWMRYDTYEEAVKHKKEGQRIVRFGSSEWTAMRTLRLSLITVHGVYNLSVVRDMRICNGSGNYLRNSLIGKYQIPQPSPAQ